MRNWWNILKENEKEIMERTVGNPNATLSDIEDVKSIFKLRKNALRSGN